MPNGWDSCAIILCLLAALLVVSCVVVMSVSAR